MLQLLAGKRGGEKLFKVQKKDGQIEDFNRNKVINGLIKSGASLEEAEKITAQVEGILAGIAVNGVIQTSEIRSKVIEFLTAVNPGVGENFASYRKPALA